MHEPDYVGAGAADYPAAEQGRVGATYFAADAFFHNRGYGLWFMAGLLADAILRVTEML